MDYSELLDMEGTGKKLRQFRFDFDLSITDVADIAATSRTMVYRWEKGESAPRAHQLVALAAYYRCRVDDLLVTHF